MSVPVIILSSSRTIFKNSLHVPVLKPSDASPANLSEAKLKLKELLSESGSESTLSQMRFFMLLLGQFGSQSVQKFEWSAEVLESAQTKFIKSREAEFEEKGKVETDEETFHRILTLAKYYNVCHGKVLSE